MKKLVRNIFEWYSSLNIYNKLIFSIISVLILILLVYIISNIRIGYDIVDYNTFYIEEAINSSEEISDRDIYLKGKTIIDNLISTYYSNYYIDDKKVKVSDFYKYTLLPDYKYEISNWNFNDNVKKIATDFISEYGTENIKELTEYSIINKMYKYSNEYNMYIFKLNLSIGEHYIGIRFENNDKYSIFYVE